MAAVGAAVGLAVGGTLYLVAFLATNSRWETVISRLFVPDLIVADWFGPPGTPRGCFDRLPVFAVAAWILLAAYGGGRFAIERLRLAEGATNLDRFVFSLAGGLNLLSLLTLAIGWVGGLHAWWLFALILAGLTLLAGWQFAADWRRHRDRQSRDWEQSTDLPGNHPKSKLSTPKSTLALAAAVGVFAALMLLAAPLPPWDFDVREYHLQVPKEWFQEGRITFLPHNVYGNMPLGAEMHATLAMTVMPGDLGWYYGALAGKVVMAAMTLITAAALFAAARRFASATAGLIAAAIYLAHPWVFHVSTSGLNDGVLAGYVFLAAYATWLARDGRLSPLVPGFLAGAAAATKYPGVVFAAIPLAIWMLLPVGGPVGTTVRRLRWQATALFVSAALAGGGLWYVKNAVLTGNPTYPLLASVLGGRTRTPERIEQWQRAHQVPRDDRGRQYTLAQAAHSLHQIAIADGLASPLVLPFVGVGLVALLIAWRQRKTALRSGSPGSLVQALLPYTLLLLVILAVWWLATHRIDRFLLSAWPLAALLAGIGATVLDARAWRWVAGGLLLVGLFYCVLLNTSLPESRLFVALEQLRRDDPWPADVRPRVNRDHRWLNENAPPGQAVLLVGDAEPFELTMPAYYNTCFDSCLLCDWMEGRTADERRQELQTRKIAYVYVHWPEIERYRGPGNYGFDPRFQAQLIDQLVTEGVLGNPLPRLTPEGDPAPPVRRPEIYPVPAVLKAGPAR